MKTFYFCEQCQCVGTVTHDDHADVMTVIDALEDAHSDAMPDCDNPRMRLRVLNIAFMVQAADVPEWAVESLTALIEQRPASAPAKSAQGQADGT